ncbi:PPC domain-containing protein [Botrimarina sp.]|uniref:PPC domain-containing protein n=1 Tax=Botrimarina sp. TaxID=2795802 RepID=UPI0032EDE3AC
MVRALSATALLLAGAVALAADPQIDRLEPQGVRRGADQAVLIRGARVGVEPQELVLYEPGVVVEKLERVDDNAVKATLAIDERCELGRHAVRVRTASGFSNLVTLHVGALERVDEQEPNNTVETAQAIACDRVVDGVVKREDEDVFAVDLVEGQRLSVEVEGLRLGRTFFDPVVELLDANGAPLAENDDRTTAYSDPYLTHTAGAAGRVYVRVRESAYRGDDRSSYLLHVGDFPRPEAVFPPAVQAGADVRLEWVEASGERWSAPWTAPNEAGRVVDAYAVDDRGVAPSGAPVLLSSEPPTPEAEPNDGRPDATPTPAPGVAVGVIGKPGDTDFWRFTATKGQVIDLRVRARELRSPLDGVLRLFDSSGKRLAGADDDRGDPDPTIRFTAPADGEYFAQVEDRLKRGGASSTYALEASPPAPEVELTLAERRRFEATTVDTPRGGKTAVLWTVTRRDTRGPLQFAFDNLPPGVTAECFPLAADYNRVPVVFHAAADAPLAGALARPRVASGDTAEGAGDPPVDASIAARFEQQTWLVRGRNNRAVWSHFADRVAVAVTEPAPFSVAIDPPKAPLCRGGSTELRVTAERAEGFDAPIRVLMLYHSPGVSSNRSRSIAKGQTEVMIPVTANDKAKTGEWPIVVTAEANVGGRLWASSGFVSLAVAEPYFDVAVPTVTTRQGESATMAIGITPRKGFEGVATLELIGLPPGASAPAVEIAEGAEAADVPITVAADAKPGRHRGVRCRVRLAVDGAPVVYTQGYAELRIDPAEPPAPGDSRQAANPRGLAR